LLGELGREEKEGREMGGGEGTTRERGRKEAVPS
jgi:hypothetical protein